jgi:PPM family protein phosphatase
MGVIQEFITGHRTSVKKVGKSSTPLVHSFRVVGTNFPIVAGHYESEKWFSVPEPKGLNLPIATGIASDTGKRTNNEDTGLVFLSQFKREGETVPVSFSVIADGMGGHWGGEFASSIVAETLAESVIEQIIVSREPEMLANRNEDALFDILDSSLQSAHALVQTQLPGGGTTATCALVIDDRVLVAHVGDCRAYLGHGEKLEQITRDHSMVEAMKDRNGGVEPAGVPPRSLLYRAVGVEGPLDVDHFTTWLEPGSFLLLCSDGLWDSISESEITNIIGSSENPQVACDRLVESGLESSGSDNTTAILIHNLLE